MCSAAASVLSRPHRPPPAHTNIGTGHEPKLSSKDTPRISAHLSLRGFFFKITKIW